ncbi:MAG: hypothetical protein HY703_07300 [Gemmatimonadetes bacterium]|nr:hypothetical protein [Gemmatimonadota bacterium]
MWKNGVIPAILAALLAQPLPAQGPAPASLQDVLGKYYQAVGGLENWKAVHSMRLAGKMSFGQGFEAPITITAKRPAMARVEFTIQGMTGIQAFDGQTAWMLLPFMGKSEAELMPPDEAKAMEEQSEFDSPLIDYQEKGHQLELLGLEEVEGTPAYKIRITLRNGNIRYYYLDAGAFLPIKTEGKRVFQGVERDFEGIISDYKDIGGGLLLPHSLENRIQGAPAGQVITLEKIELNPAVEDSIFKMPARKG